MCLCVCACLCVFGGASGDMFVSKCMFGYVFPCVVVCFRVIVRVCVCVAWCVWVCVCVCVCVCLFCLLSRLSGCFLLWLLAVCLDAWSFDQPLVCLSSFCLCVLASAFVWFCVALSVFARFFLGLVGRLHALLCG